MIRLIRTLFAVFLAGIILVSFGYVTFQFIGIDPSEFRLSDVSKKIPTFSDILSSQKVSPEIENPLTPVQKNVTFRFALIADSHTDFPTLQLALQDAKTQGASYVIGLGDYSAFGSMKELETSKKTFDESGLPFYVVPGDHDLGESRALSGVPEKLFSEVFGEPYQVFVKGQVKHVLIHNADNYLGLSEEQWKWVTTAIEKGPEKLLFVFLHEPLYHPTSTHIMGRGGEYPEAEKERKELLSLLSQKQVDEVFAGDIHFFARFPKADGSVTMTTIGAVTTERNPQTPRYVLVDVFDDYSYQVTQRVIP